MKRRSFIKLSATSSAISLFPFEMSAFVKPLLNMANCGDISNRKIVLVNLAGANDGLNTTIPLDQYTAYSELRPSIKIPENTLITLDSNLPDVQQIGLNPALTGFKNLYDEDSLRIIQAVGYPSQNKSHFKSGDLYMTGNDGNSNSNGTDSGWIGRFMELYYADKVSENYPLAIQIGSNKKSLGFHGIEEHGLSLNLTGQDAQNYYSILNGLGGAAPENIPISDYGTELDFITQVDRLSNSHAESISTAFNLGTNGNGYPDTDIANQLKTVAKLISGDLSTKVYMVRLSGFDTHNSQIQGVDDPLGKHYNLLTELSEAISAFVQDLNQQNLSEDVVGLTYSEFGRKAKENGNMGTDHGEIAPMFAFGKPISSGVSGINPDLQEALLEENKGQIKTVQHDYRQIIGTLLQDYLGADNTIIDSTFLNHTSNSSFVNSKDENLVKEVYSVPDSCLSSTLAIENEELLKQNSWQVYPNPCRTDITITNNKTFYKIEFELFNASGSLILRSSEESTNKLLLNLSHLKSGVYFLKIKTENSEETHKIVKI